jgi:hypothetical protein
MHLSPPLLYASLLLDWRRRLSWCCIPYTEEQPSSPSLCISPLTLPFSLHLSPLLLYASLLFDWRRRLRWCNWVGSVAIESKFKVFSLQVCGGGSKTKWREDWRGKKGDFLN